jgi:predicted Zn finger-like uncharacterized protein
MPIRTKCPSCKTVLRAPDGPLGQRVRCPSCGDAFLLKEEAAPIPEVLPARPPAEKQWLQTSKSTRPSLPRHDALPPRRERRKPEVVRKSSGAPVALIVGICAGVFGLFVLIAGGIALALILRSSDDSASSTPAGQPMAQANPPLAPPPPGLEPARQNIAGPQAIPDAPPAIEGSEEFVDLPERGENMPGVAGLNPEPPAQAPGAPSVRPRVVLTRGLAMRRTGQARMTFEVSYRFVQGAPTPGVRYIWVIAPARGPSYKLTLSPGVLQPQGTLSGPPPVSPNSLNSPYRIYLTMALPGTPEEIISNELTIR